MTTKIIIFVIIMFVWGVCEMVFMRIDTFFFVSIDIMHIFIPVVLFVTKNGYYENDGFIFD